MKATTYVHADTPHEIELARLRLLERRYDAVTARRLDLVEPLDGAHCLEVGAGAGSVTRMLAERVGPDGHVVALDMDVRFLTDLDAPNVTVRRHDVLADPLEEAGYDLVHCRALLLHLPDPVLVLRRMIAALRPGGLLLVEDADFATFAAVPGHPAADLFDRLGRAWTQGYEAEGSIDLSFGRRLPDILDELGLVDRGHEALAFHRQGGTPEAELFAVAYEAIDAGHLRGNVELGPELDAVIAALRDPEFVFVDSLNVAAWGRRPLPRYFG